MLLKDIPDSWGSDHPAHESPEMWAKDKNDKPRNMTGTMEHRFKADNQYGGREKGSKNRLTLRKELAEQGGLTPAQLLYCVMNDENANIGQRMKAAEKLMDFTESRLSSIDVNLTGDVSLGGTTVVNIAGLAEILAEMKETSDDS